MALNDRVLQNKLLKTAGKCCLLSFVNDNSSFQNCFSVLFRLSINMRNTYAWGGFVFQSDHHQFT